MAQITNQDILNIVSEDMAKANDYLLETAPDRFNRILLNILQQEIEVGKKEAQHERAADPSSRLHVHYNSFPLAVYEGLTQDFLNELKSRGISLYHKEDMETAMIRIVYRF